MSKKLFFACCAIFVLCLNVSAHAAKPPEDRPAIEQRRALEPRLSTTKTIVPNFAPEQQIDMQGLPVLLDGKLFSLEEIMQLRPEGLHIVLDEAGELLRAFHSVEEAKLFLGEDPTKGCSIQTKDGVNCTFYTGANCTGIAFSVPCHTCGLNMPDIRSLRTGCVNGGTTILCPSADCLGSCAGVTTNPGICFNSNFLGHSGGCTH